VKRSCVSDSKFTDMYVGLSQELVSQCVEVSLEDSCEYIHGALKDHRPVQKILLNPFTANPVKALHFAILV